MIRPAVSADAPQIAEIYGPFCANSHISFEIEAPLPAEIEARIAKVGARYPWLVDEREGTVAGYAYASSHRERAAYRWAVETTVYVREGFRGQGVARGLYGELISRLRLQGYFRAYAGISLPNPESQRLHESMGFTLVGIYEKIGYKNGAWRDVGWWQLALAPQIDSPPLPRETATP